MGTCSSENERKSRPLNNNGSFNDSRYSTRDISYSNSNKKKNNKSKSINVYNNLLKIHNDIRIQYKAPQLKLNNELCQLAQEYADKCADLQSIDLYPVLYNNECLGENISEFDGDISTASTICEDWVNESQFLTSRKYKDETKHFTQMIWKETQSVGFGFSSSSNGKNYFVTFYFPAGNIFNEFDKNIF